MHPGTRLGQALALMLCLAACGSRAHFATHSEQGLLPAVGDVFSVRVRVRGTFGGAPLEPLRARMRIWVVLARAHEVTLRARVMLVNADGSTRVLDEIHVELDSGGELGRLRSLACGRTTDRTLAARLLGSVLASGPSYEGGEPSRDGLLWSEVDEDGGPARFAWRPRGDGELEIRGRGERLLSAARLGEAEYDGVVRMLLRERRERDGLLIRRSTFRLRGEVDARTEDGLAHGMLRLDSDHEVVLSDRHAEAPPRCGGDRVVIPVRGDEEALPVAATIESDGLEDLSDAPVERIGGRGALDPVRVTRLLREHRAALAACFRLHGEITAGQVGVELTIDAAGAVLDVHTTVLDPTPGLRSMLDESAMCAAEVLSALTLSPPPRGGSASFRFPLSLAPAPEATPPAGGGLRSYEP